MKKFKEYSFDRPNYVNLLKFVKEKKKVNIADVVKEFGWDRQLVGYYLSRLVKIGKLECKKEIVKGWAIRFFYPL